MSSAAQFCHTCKLFLLILSGKTAVMFHIEGKKSIRKLHQLSVGNMLIYHVAENTKIDSSQALLIVMLCVMGLCKKSTCVYLEPGPGTTRTQPFRK